MLQPRQRPFRRPFDPSFLLAAVATGAFYYVVYQPSMQGSILHRYTTEHAVEHVIVALFIWGVFDIVWKFLSFPREILALKHDWLPPRQGREPAAAASVLLAQIAQKPAWLRGSKVGKRLVRALEFVSDKGSAEDYREHILYLAEQDDDQAHANYTLTRFVTGISPVLGFLGTVVHFGTALSGFSADDVTTKLPEIIKEMGSAFNTTAVALTTAMTMMFSLFICERMERAIVHAIDRLIERELLNRFESNDANISPFLTALQAAHEAAVGEISTILSRQIEIWSQNLDTLFERFDRRQIHEVQGWQGALDALQQRLEAHDAGRADQVRQILGTVDARQDTHMAQIQSLLERTAAAKDDFAGLTQALRDLASDEGRLVELQSHLADNLRVLRETQQIEDALHGLTGAIHLLTARHRQPGLHEAA
ncbi:MAG: MotA/TolQ/ExbB proton channel family protein [Planctomycetia bacterium]|nr:MotA/TolQ/ExbB proton channel family protein [Planctomycetia bacterium]